jgi:hypothetical protein
MKFVGGPDRASGTAVSYQWSVDVPLFPRAMVLAGETLFIAGPADTVDEEQAIRRVYDPDTVSALNEQAAAFEGRKGAVLRAVSAADGGKLGEYRLDSPPVFDGLIAAGGRLYLATVDGKVLCMSGGR